MSRSRIDGYKCLSFPYIYIHIHGVNFNSFARGSNIKIDCVRGGSLLSCFNYLSLLPIHRFDLSPSCHSTWKINSTNKCRALENIDLGQTDNSKNRCYSNCPPGSNIHPGSLRYFRIHVPSSRRRRPIKWMQVSGNLRVNAVREANWKFLRSQFALRDLSSARYFMEISPGTGLEMRIRPHRPSRPSTTRAAPLKHHHLSWQFFSRDGRGAPSKTATTCFAWEISGKGSFFFDPSTCLSPGGESQIDLGNWKIFLWDEEDNVDGKEISIFSLVWIWLKLWILLYTRDGTWPQISFLSFFKRTLDTSDVAREEKLKIGSNFRKSMDIVSVNNYCHRYRPFINSGRVLGNFDAKTRIGFPWKERSSRGNNA